MRRSHVARSLGLVLGGLILIAPAAAQIVPTFADVAYAGASTRQRLDIYLPPGPGPFPVVVWIHGGGWSGGDKSSAIGRVNPLNSRGIAVVGINYRLTGEAIFPAQIHDCKAALRFLRSSASTFRIDPSRIGAWGSSAGGHLSALLGTSGGVPALEGTVGGNLGFSSRILGAADYFGPTDILNVELDVTTPPGSAIDHDAPASPASRLVGWDQPGQGIGDIRANLANPDAPYPALVQLCNQVNPVTFVSADDPPFFIAHGTSDTSVPLNQSTRLHVALDAASVPNDYREVAGAGHGSLGPATDQAVVNFFVALFAAPNSCPADWNGSGAVNSQDFFMFLAAFFAGEGDFNRDGRTTSQDYFDFLAAFFEGCSG